MTTTAISSKAVQLINSSHEHTRESFLVAIDVAFDNNEITRLECRELEALADECWPV